MGKILILLLFSATVAFASPRIKRQLKLDYDTKQITQMLNNEALVEAQHKCLIASETEATYKCDRMGKRLRATLADTIRKANCDGCSDEEKKKFVVIITTVRSKYPKFWDDIISYYHITPDELKRLDDWIAEVQGTSTKANGEATTASPLNAKSGTENPPKDDSTTAISA